MTKVTTPRLNNLSAGELNGVQSENLWYSVVLQK